MDQLQQARAQIDEIDAKMAALFEQRMQAVGQVGTVQGRAPATVFDPAREPCAGKEYRRVRTRLQPHYRRF